MYYSLFGRCYQPRSRTCNCFPQPFNPQRDNARQCKLPQINKCPHSYADQCCECGLFIKNATFGGFVLPEGTDKRATFHVASLNLNTSGYKNFLIQLDFTTNIIAEKLKMRLRFQMFKQDNGQGFSVPISAGILYYRDKESTEANSFTLTACDCNSVASTCCSYHVLVAIEDFETGGSAILANPTLMATIVSNE